ncbi:MAG: 6-phosphofructokinase [Clostridia bacterium]|nr:6-phosphofructokinase [Clostridia bacterium]
MTKLKGAAVFGQSGGPTSVINASASGVFQQALKEDLITEVYGAAHGIRGILEEDFYDIRKETQEELDLLKTTPSSALGSVRYKLKDPSVDDTDYKRILEVFKKYNIRYFFYNGGNDSMDTTNKISKFLAKSGYECIVMGVPKTIDNDLFGTDHCPGYASAARYVATTIMEIYHDARVYDTPMITVIEIMGRNAGWLTAASVLAAYKGAGPDLIYLPEVPFTMEKFIKDVRKVFDTKGGKVIVAFSEGCKNSEGKYIAEMGATLSKDAFGHAQLGGAASVLADILKNEFKCKVRGIEFSLMQRCGAHIGSKTDVDEAFMAGQEAVKAAVSGITDHMVAFERVMVDGKYTCQPKLINLSHVANTEKTVPLEWLNKDQNFLTDDFISYALPLIQGDSHPPYVDGLPHFAKLKKVSVPKK